MEHENPFKFCPKCGKPSPNWDGEKRWSCEKCAFILYHNCAAAVAVVIRFEDEILLTIRNRNPGQGLLDLPGGFVDPRETAEEACLRELKEELNFNLISSRLTYLTSQPNLYPYKGITYPTLDLFFEYRIQEKMRITVDQKEIAEVKWIKLTELDCNQMAFESQQKVLKLYR